MEREAGIITRSGGGYVTKTTLLKLLYLFDESGRTGLARAVVTRVLQNERVILATALNSRASNPWGVLNVCSRSACNALRSLDCPALRGICAHERMGKATSEVSMGRNGESHDQKDLKG
jgi:hypothetical protein